MAYVSMIQAQPSIGFTSEQDTLLFGVQGMNYQSFIPIEVSGAFTDSQDLVVHILDLNQTSDQVGYSFESQSLTFTSDLPKRQYVHIQVKGRDSPTASSTANLILVLQSGSAILHRNQLILSFQKAAGISSKPSQLHPQFRLSLGANFDFIDGPKLNSQYTDVSAFVPHLISASHHPYSFRHRWGLHVFLYQNRSLSSSLNGSPYLSQDTTFQEGAQLKQEFLGMQLSPLFRLSSNTSGLHSPLHLFGFMHMEFTQQRLRLHASTNPVQDLQSFGAATKEVETVRFLPYFGLGLFLTYRTKELDLIVKQSAGYSGHYLPSSSMSSDEPALLAISHQRLGYHLTQVSFIEKKIGLKLGMEMRGLFLWKTSHHHSSRYFPPSFTVFLAKEVSFSKIGKLFNSVGKL